MHPKSSSFLSFPLHPREPPPSFALFTSLFPLFLSSSPSFSHFAQGRAPPSARALTPCAIFSPRWGFEGRVDSTPRLTPAPVLTRTPLVCPSPGNRPCLLPKLRRASARHAPALHRLNYPRYRNPPSPLASPHTPRTPSSPSSPSTTVC